MQLQYSPQAGVRNGSYLHTVSRLASLSCWVFSIGAFSTNSLFSTQTVWFFFYDKYDCEVQQKKEGFKLAQLFLWRSLKTPKTFPWQTTGHILIWCSWHTEETARFWLFTGGLIHNHACQEKVSRRRWSYGSVKPKQKGKMDQSEYNYRMGCFTKFVLTLTDQVSLIVRTRK